MIGVLSSASFAALSGQTPAQATRPPAIGAGTAAISGVVIDAKTRQPVSGAVVSITPQNGNVVTPSLRQITDGTGRFVFTQLGAGDGYNVGATRFGYLAGGFGRTSPADATRRIALKDGEWFADATIQLWRPAAVNGIVTDEAGEPVAGAYVRLMPQILVSGQSRVINGWTTRTDDRGMYRMANLEPGTYYVSVPSVQMSVPASASTLALSGTTNEAIAEAEAASQSIRLRRDPALALDPANRLLTGSYVTPPPPASSGSSQVYPPTYYPAARSRGDAQAVTLDYGDDRYGIDVHLAPVPGVRVSGRIEGPQDEIANLTLRMMARGDEDLGLGSETATALTTADGSFMFLNVPAGSYTLDASRNVSEYTYTGRVSAPVGTVLPVSPGRGARGGRGAANFTGPQGTMLSTRGAGRGANGMFGRARIEAGARDMTDVVVTLQRGVTMRGTIVMDPPGAYPTVGAPYAAPADGDPSLGLPGSTVSAGDPRRFVIDNLRPGPYFLDFSGGFIKSIVWNGKDYTYAPFDASAGRDFDDVVVTLTTQRPRLNGTVRDSRGAPATATVIYFPLEREQWRNTGLQPRRMRSVVASSSGTFSILNLPAGDYYVVATAPNRTDAWKDPAFLATVAPLATRVTIAWGETKSQDLVLQTVR